MEARLSKTFVICSMVVSLILYCVFRIIYNIWWKPISIGKILRRQGIRGTSYKLLRGDMGEMRRSTMDALSKPMSLQNHHIAPRVVPFFHDMVQTYGKVCMSWTETKPRLIIGDSELIRLILLDKSGDFIKTPQNPLVNLLQRGISSLEGEKWAVRRRLITPAFHLDKLKGMLPAFSESCSSLIERWTKLTSNPEGTGDVDVAPEFQILTTDVISRTAFGSSYEEGKKLFQLQKEQTVLVLEAYYNIFYIPGLRFVPTKKNRRRYKLDREIKEILGDLIRKKQQAMKNSNNKDEYGNVDLLGLLLQCKDEFMTIDDVIEECKLFYIAGQETSASLLTWTMVVLSMHPDWQQKARDEVLLLCGNKIPDFNAINHLKIVTMILNEVLRLYPPLTILLRYTKKETNIGGMSIPAGVETLLFILSLHLDPKHWGDDAEKFNPERFSEGVAKSSSSSASSKSDQNQTVFYPFGWGPRICLGQNFAMIEVKMALAMILQHFSFKLSPSYTHAPCVGLTLNPQYGAPIILHRL